ncbi:glycerol-3-phosphate acyltransferase 3 [Quillaja saponaria]|uniref:Glycerol-3-phosphate acyltransferase 3 n=1 Tax=Quillaja saponaria TaxID=32244 RepID=A0AAD7VJ45_QUISA|nr:glycerol-3-phosphate acyltransferase 3 [Quillaja saponaria]
MLIKAFFFNSLFLFCYRILRRKLKVLKVLHRTSSSSTYSKYQKYPSIIHRSDLSDHTLIFDVEGALLKSSSLFPYFMLVAFEAGGLIRAIALFLLYPFVCLVGDEMGLKIMVMVCFFGIKKDSFSVGTAVLPKFFLEDVGLEMFEVIKKGEKKVAVTNLPQALANSLITNCSLNTARKYLSVVKADKRSWQTLPRDKYPKALIFHDGRLALRPTPLDTLVMLMWLPFGSTIAIIRMIISLSLPYNISTPLLIFIGMRLTVSSPKSSQNSSQNGNLYVCNHRTLLDPLYLCFTLKKNITAVTYSLSRMSEILAPIKTVRLTRNRDQDAMMMKKLLNQGDLVVCPEGTTCREPYLLRFSPLFSEMSDEIIPVAIDTHVSMFYGTTAGGLKCLDPLFFLMNPSPIYTVRLLEKVSGLSSAGSSYCSNDKTRFDVANEVQSELGKTLGFECTKLTRKDKYLILAGNEGIVSKIK